MRATSPALPRGRRLLAAATTAVVLALGSAPLAWAAPGDNGDVKIHSDTTAVSDTRDETKVCTFYLDAFNFDTVQQVNWTIETQPGGTQVLAGSITLTNGTGNTGNLSLPDGMYKLEWTFVGESGTAKQKVFQVSCATSSPSPSPSPSSSPSPSHSPSSSPSSSPGVSPSTSPGGGPHGGVPTGGGGTSGANAAEVIGGVALLVGAGGLTVRAMRRRPGTNADS
ncbi:hypothetical protein PUR71_24965 [Streptomyces sp. SP17BM10]|uniref:hypothetical protein n=1 Tax=Streptomyces sp. SP17BM10 TaxID=3002530 RepID=UPI002E7A9EA0|nr:hypothetical protein [Streptomyces sp. SP17BM10]MEE1786124.1 hypothetical protein [Streptomyces sp. SP17BM10]